MNRWVLLAIAVVLGACASVEPQESADSPYARQLEAVQASPSGEGFRRLRELYPESDRYAPYDTTERALTQVMDEQLRAGNWPGCIESADELLAYNYTSLFGHYGAMRCHYELGRRASGEYHQLALDSLLDMIWDSGDGESPETAFTTITPPELSAFLRLHGLSVNEQSIVNHEGRVYEQVTVFDAESRERLLWWFDITAQYEAGFPDQ